MDLMKTFIFLVSFIIFRIIYSYIILEMVSLVIQKYINHLIRLGIYETEKDYYNEMEINFYKYLFSIWLWGIHSGIKPQYRIKLEQYIRG